MRGFEARGRKRKRRGDRHFCPPSSPHPPIPPSPLFLITSIRMARKDPDPVLPGDPRPSTDVPALEFRNVSISFDDVQALSGISFSLQENEMMVVTGNSGSGKSVLLRLAIGLLRPDEGAVL